MDIFGHDIDMPDSLDPKELIEIGVNKGQAGNYEEALHFFDLYLSLNPWDDLVINNKADCFMRMRRIDEARNLECWALTLNPKLAVGWCTLGEIQTTTREFFSARLNLELSLELTAKDNSFYPIIEGHLRTLTETEKEQAK